MDEIVFTNRKKRRLKPLASFAGLSNRESSHSASSHCNHLHKCESSSNVVKIIGPPPQFKLTAPPNPLNFVHINQIYEDSSHNQGTFDANFNNEKFLLYYLNLNNTKSIANDQDNYYLLVESNKDKCINYKIQVASLNLNRFSSNHTEKITNREDTKTTLMSNLNTGFSLKKQQEHQQPVAKINPFGSVRNNNNTNLFDSNLIGGSSSNATSNPNELSNMFNIFLFTCLTFITLSFLILLVYLFISRKKKMRNKKQRNGTGLSINSTFMSNNSNSQGNNHHHLHHHHHHPNFILNNNNNHHGEEEEDENAEQYHNLIETKPEFNFYNMKSCLDNGYTSVNTELIPNTNLSDNLISTFNRKTLKHLASNEDSNKLALIKPFMESAIACNCASALSSNSSASESSSSNPSVLVQKLLPNTTSSCSSFSYTLSRANNGNKLAYEKVNPNVTSGQCDTHYQKLFRSNTTCSNGNGNHALINASVNRNESILVYNNLNDQHHQLNSACMSPKAAGIVTNSMNIPNCCVNNMTLNKTAALIYNDLTNVPKLIQIVNLEDACHNQVLLANDNTGTGKFYECIQLVNFLNNPNTTHVPTQPINKKKSTNTNNEDEQFYELIDDIQTNTSPIASTTSTSVETNKNAHLNKSTLSSSSSASLMRKKYPRTNPNYSIKTSTLRKY